MRIRHEYCHLSEPHSKSVERGGSEDPLGIRTCRLNMSLFRGGDYAQVDDLHQHTL